MEVILNICRNNYNPLTRLQNVVGVGMGYKTINGIETSTLGIHVLVEQKVPRGYIDNGNLIPLTYMGFPTDVIEIGSPKFLNLTDKIRPLQGGYCISPNGQKDFTGTLSCIVTTGHLEKQYYILGNSHILAADNKMPIGTAILQPSSDDKGVYPQDKIANLSKYIKLKFTDEKLSNVNYVDCGIAKISDNSFVSNKIALIGKIKGVSKPILKSTVKKVGAFSGLTTGKIKTIGTTIYVGFGQRGSKSAVFLNQVVATNKNKGGDSGSLVLDSSDKAVGLMFSGTKKTCIFNDINEVIKALGISIYTG